MPEALSVVFMASKSMGSGTQVGGYLWLAVSMMSTRSV